MRAAAMRRRSSQPVIWKKQVTYPHLVKLDDWLTWTKEHDVSKRSQAIKAHLAKEGVKSKTSLSGKIEEKMDEEELATMLSKMDSMPEIVKIKEGGETQHFVVVLNMGPHNMNSKLIPWMKKEQASRKECGLRGVEDEVTNLTH